MSRIYGIGNDLLRIERMEKALARHGERLPQRILHPLEQARYASSKRKVNFLAKSFAVKEATV
ncbi:MAG: 4'-phosphopantetheinyl transferase superfamily protein, partial [Salinisphaeraceae bacterium]|nr:4'-phosphopantetheinyl transferase superfamily protein [Salinisphaeraceae bacterium]